MKTLILTCMLSLTVLMAKTQCDSARIYMDCFLGFMSEAHLPDDKVDSNKELISKILEIRISLSGSTDSTIVESIFGGSINILNQSRYTKREWYLKQAEYYYDKALPFIHVCLGYK